MMDCPFCGEQDFDLVGLKDHLKTDCKGYQDTLTIEEETKLRKIVNEEVSNG